MPRLASAIEHRAVAVAVGRVLRRSAHGQRRQLVAGAGQLGQPAADALAF
jgi:hypothetical protein